MASIYSKFGNSQSAAVAATAKLWATAYATNNEGDILSEETRRSNADAALRSFIDCLFNEN